MIDLEIGLLISVAVCIVAVIMCLVHLIYSDKLTWLPGKNATGGILSVFMAAGCGLAYLGAKEWAINKETY